MQFFENLQHTCKIQKNEVCDGILLKNVISLICKKFELIKLQKLEGSALFKSFAYQVIPTPF